MKRTLMKPLLLVTALLLGAGAGMVQAEKADSNKPTEIKFDQLEVDDVKQIKTFTGNVILTRGTLLMKAPKAVVTEDPEGYQYVTLTNAPGTMATFRQKRDGAGDQWVEGQAERIDYDGKTELVKLYSKAQIKRLEGNKPADQVDGEFISYDSRKEFFAVKNTANGEGKVGGGRGSMVIQPSSKNPANAANPANPTNPAPAASAPASVPPAQGK